MEAPDTFRAIAQASGDVLAGALGTAWRLRVRKNTKAKKKKKKRKKGASRLALLLSPPLCPACPLGSSDLPAVGW
jgi:hypothetical protein